jgi:hypothetical protein
VTAVEGTTMLRAGLRNSGMQDNYSLTRIPEACGTGCALPCLLCLVMSGTSTVSCGHKSESGQDVLLDKSCIESDVFDLVCPSI